MISAYTKAEWAKALRSGHYRQGKNVMVSTTGEYDALGVLIDVLGYARVPGNIGSRILLRNGSYDVGATATEIEQSSLYFPTRTLLEDMGLSYEDAHEIAALNDAGKTFAEIADVIDPPVAAKPLPIQFDAAKLAAYIKERGNTVYAVNSSRSVPRDAELDYANIFYPSSVTIPMVGEEAWQPFYDGYRWFWLKMQPPPVEQEPAPVVEETKEEEWEESWQDGWESSYEEDE